MRSGVTGCGLPSASPTPSQSLSDPGDRLGEGERPRLVGGGGGQRVERGVIARRHHQRGGERRDPQANAGTQVEPAWPGGEVESEHCRAPVGE